MCLAATPEGSEEDCALIRNCAVNEVGVEVASDPAQEATLEAALDTCAASLG